ncbi:MAG: sel1 repeat family protein, partial [Rhodospirillaceae bacterium]|nr:sel1 repeat family protein [Rhodospirillaceae bacterium]
AAKWFRKAGEQDHAAAQYNLGFLFYEGKGVQKDDQEAYHWIDQAARLGDRKAAKARETLEKVLPKEIFKKN